MPEFMRYTIVNASILTAGASAIAGIPYADDLGRILYALFTVMYVQRKNVLLNQNECIWREKISILFCWFPYGSWKPKTIY